MTVALCFPGQGSQAVGMGKELAEAFPECRAVFAEAAEASKLDLERLCFEGPLEELTETEIQQPALVATSLACLKAVETLGARPAFVVGHSVGEYAALGACGALSVADAVELVTARGKATAAAARQTPGAMAAVLGLDDAVVEELCSEIEGVWPANYNCPGQIVVSGRHDAVERLIGAATERGARRVVPLRVTGAFHSPLVAAAADALRPAVEGAAWREPLVPFMSTVTAQIEQPDRFADLLVDQLTAPVRFTQAVASLAGAGVEIFVEVGPGQVLSGLVRRCDRSVRTLSVGDAEGMAELREVVSAV